MLVPNSTAFSFLLSSLLLKAAWPLLWSPCLSALRVQFQRDGETLGRGKSVSAGEFIPQLHPGAKDTLP